jgi:hypothetical protein
MKSLAVIGLLLVLSNTACSARDTTPAATPSTCASQIHVVEDQRWPSGGHKLVLRAEDAAGEPWSGELESCLDARVGDKTLKTALKPITAAAGFTLVVLAPPPTKKSALADYRAAIEDFVASRSKEERIALYAWGAGLLQIEAFTQDPTRIARALDKLSSVASDGKLLKAQTMLDQATAEVMHVGAPSAEGQRAVVVIVPKDAAASLPTKRAAPTLQWVVEGTDWNDYTDLSDALTHASTRLDRFAEDGFYEIALCANAKAESTVDLMLEGRKAASSVLKAALLGEEAGSCKPDALLKAKRPTLDTIDLQFDDAQLARYEELKTLIPEVVTDNADAARVDFEVSVQLAPDQGPIPATAHMRGEHALRCARKSFTVNLSTGQDHYLQPGSATDEFHLIAMCEDAGYFHAFSGDTLYGEQGLFPLRFRYVEVRINGKTQGIYLLMEQTKEELQRDLSRLRGIVRRPFEPFLQPPEVKFALDETQLLAAYNALVEPADGDVRERLAPVLDVDQYLRWLAMNSILRNGDTMDESFFYSTESIDADGKATDDFRIMSWDSEDQGVVCHADGAWSFQEPHALTYCAEAKLDNLILGDAALFADYVDTLSDVTDTVTEAHYAATLNNARAELFTLLERDGVAEAMTELAVLDPSATDTESVKAAIDAQLEATKTAFAARHAELVAGIKAYRSEH